MIGQVRMAGAIAAAAGAMLCSTSAFAQSDTLREGLAQDMPELMALYRDLHEHPALISE